MGGHRKQIGTVILTPSSAPTGSPFIPIGLFIYGWTAQYEVHYIVPLFGTLVVGIG